MGSRDLITEIYYASQGDERSLAYLRNLSQAEWIDDNGLGQCLQDYPYEDYFEGFCDVVVIAGDHGIDTLREYLGSTFGPSRSVAMMTIRKIGGDSMKWAIPMLDATVADTSFPLHTRNQAAVVAAELGGRPAPEPLVNTDVPVTVEALKEGLETLLDGDYDHRSRIVKCANELGDAADEACGAALDGWFADELPTYRYQYIVRGCKPLERALLSVLENRTEHFATAAMAAGEIFFGLLEHEAFFDDLLQKETDEELIKTLAWTLAKVTGEAWIDDLNRKDSGTRKSARETVAKLEPRLLRRHVVALVDTIESYEGLYGWGDEIYLLVDALGRIPGVADAFVDGIQSASTDRYWRAQTYYQKKYIIEAVTKIGDHAPDATWTRDVAARLGDLTAEAQ